MKKTMYRRIQETNHWVITWGVACKLMSTIDFRRLPPSSAVPSKLWLSTLCPNDWILQRHLKGREDRN
jgi:hypothetical protein